MRETETKVLPVLEMSCAVCAASVESTVQALPGVEKASVNFAAGTLTVTYNPSVITLKAMQTAVQAAGYDLIVDAEDPVAMQEEMARKHYKILRRNTIGAWVLSIPLALLGMVFMHMPFADWIMMVLALAIMVFFGRSGKSQYGHIGRTQYFDRFSVQPFQYFMSRILVGKRAGTTCLL